MGQVSWGVLQRLFDDEPPLTVWREERGFEIEALAERTGIALDRLAALEHDLSRATDGEIDRLATALRLPLEYLFVPHPVEA